MMKFSQNVLLLLSLCILWVAATKFPKKCYDEHCCLAKQNPNPISGQGYLQFKRSCLDGGIHCVHNSGCELCRKANAKNKFRPVCDRFQDDEHDDEDKGSKCFGEDCCLKMQKEKYHDEGYLEYFKYCHWGGDYCLKKTGCRWCKKKHSDDDYYKPVCKRYEDDEDKQDDDKDDKNKCYDNDCCEKIRDDYYSPDSYLEYHEDCHWGGEYCLDKTGCRWCKKDYDENDYYKPFCKKFKHDDDDDKDDKKKCYDEDCCCKYKEKHYYDRDDEMEYDPDCHWGGEYCEKKMGCRWCKKKYHYGDYKKPVCRKYQDDDYHEEDEDNKCYNEECCKKMGEDYYSHDSYLEYHEGCHWGGDSYCLNNTGCRWCKKKDDHTDYHKPICKRFEDDYFDDEHDKKKCHDDDCCKKYQHYGGYLEYDDRCLWGGKNCYEKTGCCWCRKKDSHDYSRPVCKRYDH